jgi:phosphate-selective porin OprO and OprP
MPPKDRWPKPGTFLQGIAIMIQRRHLALVGALSAATFGSMAFGADASNENLKQEVAALRAELNTMKSGGSWMNDARRDEVKALVKEVLSDADTRASLQGTGATAGYNKGFFIASEDGKFLLQLGGRIQARYIANVRQSQPGGANSAPANHDIENGFEMRRVQVWFKGNIGSPKIGYFIRLAANSNTNAVGVDYAYLNYKWSDKLAFTGGRFKAAFSREELVSSGAQMAVERSAVNEAFNVGMTEGIEATYTESTWRVSGGINDGARSGEIGGQPAVTAGAGGNYAFLPGGGNSFQNDTTNYAMTGRVDYKVFGDWASWNDFSSWSGEEKSLFVGAGTHFQDSRINQNAWLTSDGGSTGRNYDFLLATADIGYKANGLSLFASANAHFGLSGGSPQVGQVNTNGGQFSDYGFLLQAGYFVIPDVIQPFIRYEFMTFDRSRNEDIAVAGAATGVGQAHDANILTAGYNWYFKKNDAKFSLDVMWAIDSVTPGTIGGTTGGTFAGAGLLPDTFAGNNNGENQVVIRAQFQLQF